MQTKTYTMEFKNIQEVLDECPRCGRELDVYGHCWYCSKKKQQEDNRGHNGRYY